MNKEERIQYVLDNIKDNVAVNITLSLVEECDELQQENKQLKNKVFTKSTTINKVKQFCENKMVKMKKSRNSIAVFLLIDILKIIEKGGSNEQGIDI